MVTLDDELGEREVRYIQERLGAVAGIRETNYNYLTKKLIVRHDPNELSPSQVVAMVRRLTDERRDTPRKDQTK